MQIDIQKTKEYYQSNLKVCNCDACQNYIKSVAEAYPELITYLKSIGIDYKKPFETFWLENRKNQTIYYEGIQYIVFGEWNKDFMFEKAGHRISCASNHPTTSITDKHFVIDIDDIVLKWSLEKNFEEVFPFEKKQSLLSKIFKRN